MGMAIDQIILAAKRVRGYGEMIAGGISAEHFAVKPRFGSTVVDCNHPAFVYGHLSLYPARLAGFMSLDVGKVAHPGNYPDLFKAGCTCQDDPERKIYPSRDELMATYTRTYDALFEQLASVKDEVLGQPHPDPAIREKFFPTLGAAATFMLCAHPAVHIGQLSTWRRCMGLPGVM